MKNYLILGIGMAVGGVLGYLYYRYVGCANGTCKITSNPYYSVLYGVLLGYLVIDLIKSRF
jgi:hypothetical protein